VQVFTAGMNVDGLNSDDEDEDEDEDDDGKKKM
jgi:hypothetical protein